MFKPLIILIAIFSYTTAQGKTKDELIKDLYGTNDNATPENKPVTNRTPNLQPDTSGGGIPGTGSCTCVPYYLCSNGSVNTNGEGIIDIR